MKHQQSTQRERDACPPHGAVALPEQEPPQDALNAPQAPVSFTRDSSQTEMCSGSYRGDEVGGGGGDGGPG